ncbi:MAG TPA: PEP-CTERM sorting domain-containing protein [Phycisphaerae bacterium]|nr:PEP-CTERM sorting domain-containing protein [Phycisphaerae bacterium]
MRSISITISLVVALAMALPALADNLNPPPWAGGPRTTMQQWEFDTPADPAAPDIDLNPYGNPYADPNPGSGQHWEPTYGGRTGVWPLSGNILAWLPNYPVIDDYKDIWIQLTWAKQVFTTTPVVSAPGFPTAVVTNLGTQVIGNTGLPAPLDKWYHTTFNIRLPYNPTEEWVRVDGTLMVDELVIHTICVPEPMSIGLLAIGGMALLRRRNR